MELCSTPSHHPTFTFLLWLSAQGRLASPLPKQKIHHAQTLCATSPLILFFLAPAKRRSTRCKALLHRLPLGN